MTPEREFKFRGDHDAFVKELHGLLARLPGRWIVWLDSKVRSDHATEEEAFEAGLAAFGLDGGFQIYRVEPLLGYGIPGGAFVMDEFKKYVPGWTHGWSYERPSCSMSDFVVTGTA